MNIPASQPCSISWWHIVQNMLRCVLSCPDPGEDVPVLPQWRACCGLHTGVLAFWFSRCGNISLFLPSQEWLFYSGLEDFKKRSWQVCFKEFARFCTQCRVESTVPLPVPTMPCLGSHRTLSSQTLEISSLTSSSVRNIGCGACRQRVEPHRSHGYTGYWWWLTCSVFVSDPLSVPSSWRTHEPQSCPTIQNSEHSWL